MKQSTREESKEEGDGDNGGDDQAEDDGGHVVFDDIPATVRMRGQIVRDQMCLNMPQ